MAILILLSVLVMSLICQYHGVKFLNINDAVIIDNGGVRTSNIKKLGGEFVMNTFLYGT